MNNKSYLIRMDIKNGLIEKKSMEFVTGDANTYQIDFELFDEGKPYDLRGCLVRFISLKQNIHQQNCEITDSSNGKVSVQLSQECYQGIGQYIGELQIYQQDSQIVRLTTPNFKYFVRKSILDEIIVEADSSFSLIQDMVKNVESSASVASNALSKANESLTISDEYVPKVLDASRKANEALDRALDTCTQQELTGLIQLVNHIPGDVTRGLFFVRKVEK